MTPAVQIARSGGGRDNPRAARLLRNAKVDPRLKPFLNELALLIARQALADLDGKHGDTESESRDLRPQEH